MTRSETKSGCRFCEELAYTGRHEPYLVDDARLQLRLWRCSRCSTLWRETSNSVLVTPPEQADTLIPGWRDREPWLAETPIDSVIEDYRNGGIDGDMLVLALLHHDVCISANVRAESQVVMYSSAAAGVDDSSSPSDWVHLSMARALDGARGKAVILNTIGSGRSELPESVAATLVMVAGGTVNDSERTLEE